VSTVLVTIIPDLAGVNECGVPAPTSAIATSVSESGVAFKPKLLLSIKST
jgi:hypothetical protein